VDVLPGILVGISTQFLDGLTHLLYLFPMLGSIRENRGDYFTPPVVTVPYFGDTAITLNLPFVWPGGLTGRTGRVAGVVILYHIRMSRKAQVIESAGYYVCIRSFEFEFHPKGGGGGP